MTDDRRSNPVVIHVWLNQQTSPPEIEINGEIQPVKSFSLRFDYQAEEKYRGELTLAMDWIPFRDEVTVICAGLQWRGRITGGSYAVMGSHYQEVTIGLVGPPLVVRHREADDRIRVQ